MRIRINLKPVISLFLLVFLAACGNSKQMEAEKKSLQTENEALKTKVQQLIDENNKFKSEIDSVKAELEELKQTDMYLYSKAMEYIKGSKKTTTYKEQKNILLKAKEYFEKLLSRFPASQYKSQAEITAKSVNDSIQLIDKVDDAITEINKNIQSHDYAKAMTVLKSIKSNINDDYYKELARMIEEEQNKPIVMTIAEFDESWRNLMGKTVTISGYLSLYQGYGAGLPAIYQICEKAYQKGLCFQNITIKKDIETNVDRTELKRKYKEIETASSVYATTTGKVDTWFGANV